MKNIDIKSLLIGTLLASTIFLGVAATSPTDKWDKEQRWEVGKVHRGINPSGAPTWIFKQDTEKLLRTHVWPAGWEPISYDGKEWRVRKRTK